MRSSVARPIGFQSVQKDVDGFSQLSQLLKSVAGINLPSTPKNLCLMASRLGPILREKGIESYQQYARHLEEGGEAAMQEFVCALTTNTTQFFREAKHFDVLKQVLPAILERKHRKNESEIRIWCAAASTGQEPYTIAMTILEQLGGGLGWDIKMLATDIDQNVLERASSGLYSESEAASIPALYRQKYFKQLSQGKDRCYQVTESMRKHIRFAPFNLLTPQFPFKHPFDIIFCRNVLIYFDAPTCTTIVEKLSRSLGSGGYLFLGHSESGAMRTSGMRQIAPAAYQRDQLKAVKS